MVTAHLFIGQDHPSKEIRLKKLKEQFLSKGMEHFNSDLLYGRELTLKQLQERLLCLPLGAKKRIVIVKEAHGLKENIKEFLCSYLQKPSEQVVLVLDMESVSYKDQFINRIARYVQISRFKEERPPDAFLLSRHIACRRTADALKVLHQLLQNGERPERIVGGLRYSYEKGASLPMDRKRHMKLLLRCDIEIKTGRIVPQYALEKLVIGLCSLGK